MSELPTLDTSCSLHDSDSDNDSDDGQDDDDSILDVRAARHHAVTAPKCDDSNKSVEENTVRTCTLLPDRNCHMPVIILLIAISRWGIIARSFHRKNRNYPTACQGSGNPAGRF